MSDKVGKESITKVIQIRRSGQMTIPSEFRKQLGIEEDSLVQVTLDRDELRIRPLRLTTTTEGSPWLKALYDRFAPTREEARKISEEEINEAIDRAVAAVRRKKDD